MKPRSHDVRFVPIDKICHCNLSGAEEALSAVQSYTGRPLKVKRYVQYYYDLTAFRIDGIFFPFYQAIFGNQWRRHLQIAIKKSVIEHFIVGFWCTSKKNTLPYSGVATYTILPRCWGLTIQSKVRESLRNPSSSFLFPSHHTSLAFGCVHTVLQDKSFRQPPSGLSIHC